MKNRIREVPRCFGRGLGAEPRCVPICFKGGYEMEEKIKRHLKRLKQLGYSAFQIEMIICEAIGTDCVAIANSAKCRIVLSALERYEKLGSMFVAQYSK